MQYQKGNIALKEVIRLKAFLFSLENDQKNLRAQITESQAILGVLINDSTNAYYQPVLNKKQIDSLNVQQFNLVQLTEAAYVNRYDLKAAEADTRYERQNLSYQKALAIPDCGREEYTTATGAKENLPSSGKEWIIAKENSLPERG